MYIQFSSAIIDSHSIRYHSFADDLQLQMSATPDKEYEPLPCMQSFISNIKAWTIVNMPKLNDNKIQLMFVNSRPTKHLHNLLVSLTNSNGHVVRLSVCRYRG